MASDWSLPHGGGPNSAGIGDQDNSGVATGYNRIQTSTLDRPHLRSHKSFPYTLGTSSYASPHSQSPLSQFAAPVIGEEAPLGTNTAFKAKGEAPPEMAVQMSFGGSAPVSPVPQLTPTSVVDENKDIADVGDEDVLLDEEDEDEEEEEGEEEEEQRRGEQPREKTAAERRAEKRKMKRFRLTHNQTRFLMSEFARQAHPDAAQRERLSREIPGLSPRQVQVWFQNRRAKLKRLTTDDREKIMKSRALPEDFDMTQALHSPFIASGSHPFTSQAHTTPLVSPAAFPLYDGGLLRPLNISGLRRESGEDNTISPISMSSNYGQFFTPPASVTTSETLSPVSPTNDRAPFMAPSYPQPSPRGANIWSNRSSSFSNYHTPHVPRLQLHDRISRSRAESLASPLRTSMSYTGNLDHATTTTETSVTQPHSVSQQGRAYWQESLSNNQGSADYSSSSFQASALVRPGPVTTTFPPGLNLQPQSRSLLPFSSRAQTQGLQTGRPDSQPAFQNIQQGANLSAQQAPPQANTQSTFYGSSPQSQIPVMSSSNTQSGMYNVQYPDAEDDSLNPFGTSGVASEPVTSSVLEPESYYRSEPYSSRHSAIAGNLGFDDRPHSRSFGESMAPQSPTPMSRPMQQALHSPYLAGSKRRRDSLEAGSEPDRSAAEYEGGSRKRSYTMPSGFRGGLGS